MHLGCHLRTDQEPNDYPSVGRSRLGDTWVSIYEQIFPLIRDCLGGD